MIYDVFEPHLGVSNPHNPGKYLGSIEIPTTYTADNINPRLAAFDLHLRATGRKAYGETYGLISQRKPYSYNLGRNTL